MLKQYRVKHAVHRTTVMDQLAFQYGWQDADKRQHFAVNYRELGNAMQANGGVSSVAVQMRVGRS